MRMKTVTIAIQVPVDEIDLSGSEVTVERSAVEAWGNEQIITQRFIALEAKWHGIEIALDATPMLVVEEFNQIVLENHS